MIIKWDSTRAAELIAICDPTSPIDHEVADMLRAAIEEVAKAWDAATRAASVADRAVEERDRHANRHAHAGVRPRPLRGAVPRYS